MNRCVEAGWNERLRISTDHRALFCICLLTGKEDSTGKAWPLSLLAGIIKLTHFLQASRQDQVGFQRRILMERLGPLTSLVASFTMQRGVLLLPKLFCQFSSGSRWSYRVSPV